MAAGSPFGKPSPELSSFVRHNSTTVRREEEEKSPSAAAGGPFEPLHFAATIAQCGSCSSRLWRRVLDRVGRFPGSLLQRALDRAGLVQGIFYGIDDGLPRRLRHRLAWGRRRAWCAGLRRLLPAPNHSHHHHPNHHRQPASPPLHRALLRKSSLSLFLSPENAAYPLFTHRSSSWLKISRPPPLRSFDVEFQLGWARLAMRLCSAPARIRSRAIAGNISSAIESPARMNENSPI